LNSESYNKADYDPNSVPDDNDSDFESVSDKPKKVKKKKSKK